MMQDKGHKPLDKKETSTKWVLDIIRKKQRQEIKEYDKNIAVQDVKKIKNQYTHYCIFLIVKKLYNDYLEEHS